MKDLAASSPFAAASLANFSRGGGANSAPGMEGFAALPFLSHMAATGAATPGGCLHHFVDPRHPFSAAFSGAFRPFLAAAASSTATSTTSSNSLSSTKSFPSAFQPPNSNASTKLDRKQSPTLFSPGQNLFPRNASVGKFILSLHIFDE